MKTQNKRARDCPAPSSREERDENIPTRYFPKQLKGENISGVNNKVAVAVDSGSEVASVYLGHVHTTAASDAYGLKFKNSGSDATTHSKISGNKARNNKTYKALFSNDTACTTQRRDSVVFDEDSRKRFINKFSKKKRHAKAVC